ncbi:hypothetical protein ACLKA6_012782 [Drosophila palustris]
MDADTAIQTNTIMPAAITVAQKGSSNSNSNNNSSQQAFNTSSGLEGFFRQENEIWEEQQEEQKQQQKWNLVKSSKIPTLFLPKVEKYQPILYRPNGLEGVANGYTTKCTQNGAIRLLCNSMDVYNKISRELHNRGFRIVIRHLHSTTEPKWIQEQLIADGCMPRFIGGKRIRICIHGYISNFINSEEDELRSWIQMSRADMSYARSSSM